MSSPTLIALPYEPTVKRLEAATVCLDADARVIALDGAYRSAKTQAGARVLVEWALEYPSQYLVARATYRSLKDTVQKALMHGDGGLPPLIPKEAISRYRASDEVVRLKNGSEIMFRSLEADQTEKLRGLTLGAVLIDQVEELDGGVAGERIFDTLLGRLSDPGGPRKLIAISNPAGLTHWYFRRVVSRRTRDAGVRLVHFKMTDNPHLPADYIAEMLASKLTRPHWYRSFVEGVWGAFEGMAYEEFDPAVHVFEPFEVPADWERSLSFDHGAANPTAVHAWAADYDGNVLAFGEYYEAGQLVSDHARAIKHRCAESWIPGGLVPTVIADPSTGAKSGISNKLGAAGVGEDGVRRAWHLLVWGEQRSGGRVCAAAGAFAAGSVAAFPSWHPRAEELGSPRLFISSECVQLIEQFKSAPVAEEGVGAGECADAKWESSVGHAHAGARYFAMTRPSPSPTPAPVIDDPRLEFMLQHEERRDSREPAGRYEWSP